MSGESPEPADTQEDAAEIVHEVKAEETDTPKEEIEEKTEEEGGGGEEAEAETEPATRSRPKRKASAKIMPVAKKEKKNKKKEEKATSSPTKSGFSKPIKVSEKLADFIGQSEISRPQLTKFMWSYFKEKGLQDPKDKRHIIADDKLKELLNVDRFNAFGFMKLVKPHFIG